jgi:hypothetical protein
LDPINRSEDSPLAPLSRNEDSDWDYITVSEDSDLAPLTSSEDSDWDPITVSEDSPSALLPSSEDSDSDPITVSEDSHLASLNESEDSQVTHLARSKRGVPLLRLYNKLVTAYNSAVYNSGPRYSSGTNAYPSSAGTNMYPGSPSVKTTAYVTRDVVNFRCEAARIECQRDLERSSPSYLCTFS